ncbi:MAG TPA: prephenate dehydrogenase/arogenate dehydrogenase family protein, partial [Acidothermaceae bacterium]|nr:prephenate dehydrogenase/arogenate dehydrogenase family protein [Acidothermaceae bacterium]
MSTAGLVRAGDGESGTAGIRRVLIVGAGLIGTSIGLALRQRFVDVALEDHAPGRLALATELGAGRPSAAGERFDVAVVAVPPAAVASELLRLQRLDLARTYTDVASAKAEPQREAELTGVDMSTYVGG